MVASNAMNKAYDYNQIVELVKDGYTAKAIKEKTGCSLSNIYRIRKIMINSSKEEKKPKAKKEGKEYRDSLIIGLIEYQLTNVDIGKIVDCSVSTINILRKKVGIPAPVPIKSGFNYREHTRLKRKLKPDTKLDEMLKYGFTIQEILNEYNYEEESVHLRVKHIVLEQIKNSIKKTL